jgi:uncharacterized membrane protein YczE
LALIFPENPAEYKEKTVKKVSDISRIRKYYMMVLKKHGFMKRMERGKMKRLSFEGFRAMFTGQRTDMDWQMKRRILMMTAGVSITGLSTGFFTISDMGYDPFQVFVHGVWSRVDSALGISVSYGTYFMLISFVLLMAMFMLNRGLLGLGTLFTLFLAGYLADFSAYCLRIVFPDPGFAVRLALLGAGIVIMCFSAALYYTAGLGVSTYDAVALTISQKQPKIAFRWCRIFCDLICVLIGLRLGSSVGIGTIITALFMGPLIDFFRRAAAEPLLDRVPQKAPVRRAA